MRFSKFADYINGISGPRPKYLRLGQYASNCFYDMEPEISNKLRGTEFDPFYVDARLPKFLAKILTDYVEMDDSSKKL